MYSLRESEELKIRQCGLVLFNVVSWPPETICFFISGMRPTLGNQDFLSTKNENELKCTIEDACLPEEVKLSVSVRGR